MKKIKDLAPLVGVFIFLLSLNVKAEIGLDMDIKPDQVSSEISKIYQDMVVVQRKAKIKEGSFLFNPSFSFDFSDGPQTMYGMNLNFGYAVSDFWEVYVGYTPAFITNERPIVDLIEEQVTEEGQVIKVTTAEPKSQISLDLLWIPAYGKDSWGPKSIVRSDTFFKLSVGAIDYSGESGLRFGLGLGKTYFISKWFNLRATASLNSIETIVNEQKSSQLVAVLEAGLVFYF